MAASLQLITTKVGKQRFAKTWHITTRGLTWLQREGKTNAIPRDEHRRDEAHA